MFKRQQRLVLLFLACLLGSLVAAAYNLQSVPPPAPPPTPISAPPPQVAPPHPLPNLEAAASQSIPKHALEIPAPQRQGEQNSPTSSDPLKFETPRSQWAVSTPPHAPVQMRAKIDPTNFGERLTHDIYGLPLRHRPLVVLHETVYSAMSALNYFRTPHPRDEDQASYHALITLDGTIIYLVPAEQRAYGAGNSVFEGDQGPETVQTNPQLPPSVNNFAYHIALETPADGENQDPIHSGYTPAQYQSLAWLVARTRIPEARITTHAAIDQGGERMDPRSFEFDTFRQLLAQQRQAWG